MMVGGIGCGIASMHAVAKQEARALDLYFLSIGLIAGAVLPLSKLSDHDHDSTEAILIAKGGLRALGKEAINSEPASCL